jgi:hypothetical protein
MTLNKPDWWDDWTTYNPEKMEVELKEDAPPKVRREWNAIQKVMFPELPEKPVE